jgi:serine/threonine protein kinase
MSQSLKPRRLKRIKAILPSSSKSADGVHSRTTETATPGTFRRILRILLGDPWDDYDYIGHLDQVVLARHKASYFKLVNIRQFYCLNALEHALQQSQILSSIQHPNIASIYDVYCCDDSTFLVTEHLNICISQLELQKYDLEEWEIATIIAEVLTVYYMKMLPDLRSQVIKGVAHISSLKLSCKELSSEHIRLSLDGEIKLGTLAVTLLTLFDLMPLV